MLSHVDTMWMCHQSHRCDKKPQYLGVASLFLIRPRLQVIIVVTHTGIPSLCVCGSSANFTYHLWIWWLSCQHKPVCMCMLVCVYMHVPTDVHVCVWVRVCVYMCVPTHAKNVCVYVHACASICVCLHLCQFYRHLTSRNNKLMILGLTKIILVHKLK